MNISINGISKNIEFNVYNGVQYVSVKSLGIFFNDKSKVEVTAIKLKSEVLKFADGSFFVVFEDTNYMRVAQMSLPCIKIKDLLFIPIKTFLNSLAGIGLIKIENSNGEFIISTNIFQKYIPPVKSNSDIQLNKSIKDKSALQKTNFDSIKSFQYNESVDTSINPNKYIIPQKLNK
jgi:hypothetical protein